MSMDDNDGQMVFGDLGPGRGRWIVSERKILSMSSFGSEVMSGSHVVHLRHVKEPPAEIRASKQNLSDFSRSLSEATLMT